MAWKNWLQDLGWRLSLTRKRGGRRSKFRPQSIPVEVTMLESRCLLSNHAPIGTSNTVTVAENTPYTFQVADFGFSDPNDTPANTLLAVKIASTPAAGSLTDNGTAVTAGQYVSAPDISGGKLVFTPATNVAAVGDASFTFQVQDNGGTSGGGADTDPTPKTMTVNVSSLPVAAGSETRVNTYTTNAQLDPSVASDAAGDYVVTWQSNGQSGGTYGIYAQRYNAAGAAQGSEFQVNSITTYGNQTHPKVAMDAAGDFAIVWQSAGNTSGIGAYAQRYNSAGVAQGSEFLVASGSTPAPAVAMDATGDFVVTWTHSYKHNGTTYSDIVAQRYNAAGTTVGSTFNADSATTNSNFSDSASSVAMDQAGDFVISWQSETSSASYGIYAHRYNAAGTAQGSILHVSAYTTNQKFPSAAMDAAGDFVVAWESLNQDGSGYGIYSQRYTAAGSASGSNFKVNTYTTGNQARPSTSMDRAGDFVVSWESVSQDGSGYGTYAQSYTSAGATQSSEFKVNTYSIGSQALPTVALNATGNFVVAWQSASQDGSGYGIYSQRYSVLAPSISQAPTGTSNSVTTLENAAYTLQSSDFGFSDPNDSPANTLLAVKITTLPAAGTLTDNGTAVTAGQYITASDISSGKLVFTPATNASGTGYASFTFQVQDNGGTANGGADTDPSPKTLTVNVTHVNQAPAGTTNTVATAENTAYAFQTTDFGFTDPNDSPANTLLAVKITTLPSAGTLTDNGTAVTAGQYVSATDISSSNLVFTPAANASSAPYASFTFQVEDNGGTTNGGVNLDPTPRTLTVNVTTVWAPNHAPTGASTTVTTLENVAYTVQTADFGFSDPNDSPANSLLAVKITTLPAGTLTDNGTAVTAGQFVSASDVSSGKLVFTPSANSSGTGSASFTFQVQDDGGTSNGGTSNGGTDTDPSPKTFTVNVTPVNQAPVGTANTVTTAENTAYAFQTADFGFTDPNDRPANSLLAVKITTIPSNGTLTDNGTAVTAGQYVSATDISSGNLVFTPTANVSSTPYTSFTFQVEDNGGTTNGGVNLDPTPRTLTVNVVFVDHAPVGTSNTVTTLENVAYTVQTADFGFSDPNDTPANALLAVKITTLPTAGTLTDNGTAVTAGQFVSASDISSGKLVFTPAANASGTGYANFTFQVQDNGGTANGGTDTDPSSKILTFNVTQVNQSPVGTSNTITTAENTAYAFQTADFGFTDPHDSPANSLSAVKITTLPNTGSLTDNGTAVTAGQYVSASDISSGNLVFTPATNSTGTPDTSFTFQVQDNGGTANGSIDTDASPKALTINVAIVNHAPVGTSNTMTTLANTQYEFSQSDFGFTDPNDSPANTMTGVVITTVPAWGTLTTLNKSGTQSSLVTAGEFISTSQLSFIKGLYFNPGTTGGGAGIASFTFQVEDNGSTANGGANLDPSPKTMTVQALAAPQVTSLATTTGSTVGGTSVTINGTGFLQVSVVMFGSSLATSFTVNSPTSITAIAPAAAAGTVDVTIVNSLGASTASTADQFTYQAPPSLPAITHVSPGTATTTGGDTITITGSNFTGATAVMFGTTPAASYTVTSPSTITAVAPAHVSGNVDVQVTTSGGTSVTGATDQLLFTVPVLTPIITNLSTASGSTAGRTSVTIMGVNFTGATQVMFGSVPATSFVVNSANSITAIAPAEAAGQIDVYVTNSVGTSGATTNDQFTFVSPVPVISQLSINNGSISGGTSVTISGTNLAGVTQVLFGGVPATSFEQFGPNTISAVAPAATTAGPVDITLQSPNGTSAVTTADQFTYLAPLPTVTGISSLSGIITGGTAVTISGSHLAGATAVMFGSAPASSFTVNSDGTITAISPVGTPGFADVTVTTSAGTSAVTSADQFAFTNPAPMVTGVNDDAMTPGGGDNVTIAGSHFIGASTVLFGTTPAISFTILNDGSITAVAPVQAIGNVDITVVNAAGTSTTSSADQFTYQITGSDGSSDPITVVNPLALPVISGLDTDSGSTAGGDTVTLYGIGFLTVTGVTFGTVPAASFQVNSDTSMTAVIPTESAGAVNVILQTASGSTTPTDTSQFTFMTPGAAPSISAVTSSGGTASPGSVITIQGSNFNGATAVSLGGQPATFTVESPTTILAVVPSGLTGTIDASVTTGTGTSATAATDQFGVTGAAQLPNGGSSNGSSATGGYSIPSTDTPSYGTTVNSNLPSGWAGFTIPTMPSNQPVTTEDGHTTSGLNDFPLFQFYIGNYVTVDHGTTNVNTTTTTTNPDGSVLISQHQSTTTFASSEGGTHSFAGGASSFMNLTSFTRTLDTLTLIAANGTGYTKVDGSTDFYTYQNQDINGAVTYSSTDISSNLTGDDELGIGSQGPGDEDSQINVEHDRTINTSSGAFSTTAPIITHATETTTGTDGYTNGESNSSATNVMTSTSTGHNTWSEQSSSSGMGLPDGRSTSTSASSGTTSGIDDYNTYDVATSTTAPFDPNGTETLDETTLTTDSGIDQYYSETSATKSTALDGSVSTTSQNDDSFDGSEHLNVNVSGEVTVSEAPSDGSVNNANNGFLDITDDQSTYTDADVKTFDSAHGGAESISSGSNEDLQFSASGTTSLHATTSAPTGAAISINSAGVTDDAGQVLMTTSVEDGTILAPDGTISGETLRFWSSAVEQDHATGSESVNASAVGLVAPGNNANSTKTITDAGVVNNSEQFEDNGVETFGSDGSGNETETVTDTTAGTGTFLTDDRYGDNESQSNADGSVVTSQISHDDTDNIAATNNASSSDVISSLFGPTRTTESSNDNNVFNSNATSQDQYQGDNSTSSTGTLPIAGGSAVMSLTSVVTMVGTLSGTDNASGSSNSSDPTSAQETDTTNLTNTDQGTLAVTGQLDATATAPVTGVLTIIHTDENLADNFTHQDGDDASGGTSAGVTIPTSESTQADETDHITAGTDESFAISGAVTPGTNVDYSEQSTSTGAANNFTSDSSNTSSSGGETESDQYGSAGYETTTGSSSSIVAVLATAADGEGNTNNRNESGLSATTLYEALGESVTGEENLTGTNGQITSDTESSTDARTSNVNMTSHAVTYAHDSTSATDSTTGLLTTAAYDDNGSTDDSSTAVQGTSTDVHSSSLGMIGTDVVSNELNGQTHDVQNNHREQTVGILGTDAQGVHRDQQQTSTADISQTEDVTYGDSLLANGTQTNTTTDQLAVAANLTTLLHGTSVAVDPTTSATATTTFNDHYATAAASTSAGTDVKTTSAGTTTDVPTQASGGTATQHWQINDLTTQVDPSGNELGTQTNNGSGEFTQTAANGVVTAQGAAPPTDVNAADQQNGQTAQNSYLGDSWWNWLWGPGNTGTSGSTSNPVGQQASEPNIERILSGQVRAGGLIPPADPMVAGSIGFLYGASLLTSDVAFIAITVGVPGPEDLVISAGAAAMQKTAQALGLKLVATEVKGGYNLLTGTNPVTQDALNAVKQSYNDAATTAKAAIAEALEKTAKGANSRFTVVRSGGDEFIYTRGPFGELIRTVNPDFRLTGTAANSFSSFDALKRGLGSAGEGNVWHHIVEQRAANVAKFGAEAIHSTGNVVSVSQSVNQAIANYYSSKRAFTDGLTVRNWLGTQSFAEQDEFGLDILSRLLAERPLP